MTETSGPLSDALRDRYVPVRELGHGGMATVYLARDVRHDRLVAVKVLRPELAAFIGAERFLAEIRTTANLQHPHILPLFDSGQADMQLFYVMPYVEGGSLRSRLGREHQLAIPEALRIAREVASALDYAHRHGVVHRDIKPENILLHDGSALVADFGIALAATSAGSRMTETGMSIGTPQYMSPEQAMGERDITPRADVYALGVVLYEMLAGEPPFTGPSAQAIVAKVLTEPPVPVRRRRDRVTASVEAALLTALEKLPADRFASADLFARALDAGGDGTRAIAASAAHSRGWMQIVGAALVVAFGASIGGFMIGRGHRNAVENSPPFRLVLFAPAAVGSEGLINRQLTLTPDGRTVIYTARSPTGENVLVRQELDDVEGTRIAGSAGGINPHVSPDGRELIAEKITGDPFRLPIDGGTPRALPTQVSLRSGAWGPDTAFWFTREGSQQLARLSPNDSVSTYPDPHTRGFRVQQLLDDHTLLVVRRPTGTGSGPCLAFDLRTGVSTPILATQVVEVRYTSGYLIYAQPDGSLRAVAFDPSTRRVSGQPVRLALGVAVTGTGVAQLAVADNGTVAYILEDPFELVLVDRHGVAQLATTERHNFHAPHFSSDGRRLSVDFTTTEGRDVWVLSLDDSTLSRATFDNDGHDATWMPDGHSFAYLSSRSGTLGVYRSQPGSAAPPESLFASPQLSYTGLWLPDGSATLNTASETSTGSGADIVLVRNGGRGPIEALVATPYREWHPSLSFDGRWMAFESNQSGKPEVYVRTIALGGEQVQVSLEGGSDPLWAPNGRELFYWRTVDGKVQLMVVGLRLSPTVQIVSRRVLFPIADILGATPHVNYDISPDGRTFVMVRQSKASRIAIIQNVAALIRRSASGNPTSIAPR